MARSGRLGFESATVLREQETTGGQRRQREGMARSPWAGMVMRAEAMMSTSEGWIPVNGVQFGGWPLPNALRPIRLCLSMRRIGSGWPGRNPPSSGERIPASFSLRPWERYCTNPGGFGSSVLKEKECFARWLPCPRFCRETSGNSRISRSVPGASHGSSFER